MANVQFPTISDPGTFVFDETKPTKYTEAASHAVHQVLYALSDAGFEISDGSELQETLEKGLLYPDPQDEDNLLSVLKLLASVPIKVTVESVGMLEDVSVSPS